MVHVWLESQIYCNFCLQNISTKGLSKMERSQKQGKHLRRQEIMTFNYRWPGWWDHGPWGRGLRAQQIAIDKSIVTPLLYPRCEAICLTFDWLQIWVGVIVQNKVVNVLVDELMWLYCCTSITFPCHSWVLTWKVPTTIGSHIPLTCIMIQSLV